MLLCLRMGIPTLPTVAELAIFSPDGEGERPEGVPIEVGRMKSSRFIVSLFATMVGGWGKSELTWLSDAFLSCAIPLGAEGTAPFGCRMVLRSVLR
jgi:hypothetical protein